MCCCGSPEPSEFSESLMSEDEGKGVWMHEGSCVEQVPSAKPYQQCNVELALATELY